MLRTFPRSDASEDNRAVHYELEGLDPFDALDREAELIEAHLTNLTDSEWLRPSRCAGWTTRDVLGHLRASEDYHHACLDSRVSEFIGEMTQRGATDIAAFNELGIAALRETPSDDLVCAWSAANADTRRRFRERGDGDVDTSIGAYPNRLQAFHIAGELATHADDIGVLVPDARRSRRREWRVRFSRFALHESKPDVQVEATASGTRVTGSGLVLELDDDEFIDAVAGRASNSRLDRAAISLLSTMP